MYALDEMRGVGEKSDIVTRTKGFDYPLKKDRQKRYKVKSGERIRVNMTSDTFVEEADEWRDEMWDIIRKRPDVIFWILTKRPERMAEHLPPDWGDGWDNVSLNITCEDQDMFTKRWAIFEKIQAKHKGLCLAPLLGPIDIRPALMSGQIEEVSCGGENYNDPRPCHDTWVEDLSYQCAVFHVNFIFYETGTFYVCNGVMHNMPYKSDQSVAAYRSGYSRKFYEMKYDLRSPDDGHLLTDTELHKKIYNLYHCLECANILMCNGCSNCGNCRNVSLVDAETLVRYKTSASSVV